MNKARPSRLHPRTPSSYEVPGRNLCPYGDTLHIRWVAGRRRYRDDLVEPGGTPPGDNSVRFWWHERNDGNFLVVRIDQHSPVWRQSHLAPSGSQTVTATGVLGAVLGAASTPNQASLGTGYADINVKIVSP